MPTYLVHGFRWSRQSIRIHILLHNLEDAAAEWVVAPATSITLLNSFYSLYDFLPPSNPPKLSISSFGGGSNGNVDGHAYKRNGSVSNEAQADSPIAAQDDKDKDKDVEGKERLVNRRKSKGKLRKLSTKLSKSALESTEDPPTTSHSNTPSSVLYTPITPPVMPRESFNDWSIVKLLEQYNPDDMTSSSQPYAYVSDYIVPIDLSIDISKEIEAYERRCREERGEVERSESPVLGHRESVRMSVIGPPTPTSPIAMQDEGDSLNKKLSMRELKRKSRRLDWFPKLRDSLQKGGDIGWYIVVCGDEERADGEILDEDEMDTGLKTPRSAGIKGFFRR